MHLVTQLAVAVIALLVLLGPGTAVVALRRMHRTLPGPLLTPTAMLLTLAFLSVLTFVALLVHAGMWLVLPLFAVGWAVAWAVAARSLRADLATEWPPTRSMRRARQARRGLTGRVDPDAYPAAGATLGWRRAIVASSPVGALVTVQLPLLVIAGVSAICAFIAGGWLTDGDALYHVSVAMKLQHLAHPTFASIQPFVDGSAHPGYLVPVWHEFLALVAAIAGATPATAVWVLPAIVTPIAALTAAGLAQVLLRSPRAAIVGAVAWLLADVAMEAPSFGLVASASFPATIDIVVLLPLAAALWISCLWNTRSATRRQAFGLLLVSIPVIVLLHVNYVVWLGMAIGGYLIVWGLQAPWSRAVVRRHLGAAAAVAVVTVACLAALLPILSTMSAFGGGADAAFVEFRPLLVGSKHAFHLRPDLVVASGVLALVGLIACSVVLLVPRFQREPFAWLLGGSALMVLAISQLDPLFTVFSHVMSVSQSKRIGYALPHALGFGTGAMLVGWWADRWWRVPRRRIPVIGGVLATGVVLQYATTVTPKLEALRDPAVLPGWLVQACGIVLVLTLAGMAALLVRRLRSAGGGAESKEPGSGPVLPLGIVGVVATTVVLAMSGAAGLRSTASALRHDAAQRPTTSAGVDDLGRVDAQVARALRKDHDGRVIMVPNSLALRFIAVAPDYVVGVPLSHIAGTPKNRRGDRRNKVNEFYSGLTSDGQRLHLLDTQKVNLVVLGNNPASSVYQFTRRHKRVFVTVATGRTQLLLRVNRGSALRRG